MIPQGVKGSIREYLTELGPSPDEKWRSKMPVFGISLLISIVLWLIINLSQDRTHTLSFRVDYDAWPAGCLPVDPPDSVAQVTVSATGFQILSFMLQPGARTLHVRVADHVNDNDSCGEVRLQVAALLVERFGEDEVQRMAMSPEPGLLRINNEPMLSRRLPVRAIASIVTREQYAVVGDIRTLPDTVTLTGPASVLMGLETVATENVRLDGISDDVELKASVPPPAWNVRVEPTGVTLRARVEKYTEKVVGVSLPSVADGLEEPFLVIPSKVDVHLSVPLSMYDDLGPDDIGLSLQKSRPGSYLTVSVRHLPDGIRVVRITPPEAEYFILPSP